jgi:hypothetical protein
VGCLSGQHGAGRQDFDLFHPPPGGKRRLSDRDQTPAPRGRRRAFQMAQRCGESLRSFWANFSILIAGDSSETRRSGIEVSGARWQEIVIKWDDEHIKVGDSSLELVKDFDQQLQFYSVSGLMAMWETDDCCQVFYACVHF